MELQYKIQIDAPSTHQVRVLISGKKAQGEKFLDFFLPRWSPGSYLIREYVRHLSKIEAHSPSGERLFLEQIDTSTFRIDWSKSQLKKESDQFLMSYMVYCHELTVRTSHVDEGHAFLHLPSLLMGLLNKNITKPTLEVVFPPSWSKLTTGLKDISQKREQFLYSATDFDELIDSPLEIGCHETDGFKAFDVDHDLAFYGKTLPFKDQIKTDTKKIVEHIAGFFGGVPYEKYSFINHFVPGLYGGLEHSNSTALHYCPFQLTHRKGYINYLALISHEYFHTWNVKRIRPLELGPFDYLKEAHSKLLWLAEGLTSLMDELFIYRAGLINLEEYLEMQKDNLNRYYGIPGRRFHSLDESSYNAWVKLYRPDENTNNSSVSYYLKGGIVFFALNLLLAEKNKSINDFLKLLWSDYKKNPQVGLNPEKVYDFIQQLAGEEIRHKFELMTQTTEDIDLESLCLKHGMKFDWEKAEVPWLGIEPDFHGDRITVRAVTLDGPAYKAGVNAGDEIIAIDNLRLLKDRFLEHQKFLQVHQTYQFCIARQGQILHVNLNVGVVPSKLKSIQVIDKEKITQVLNPL